MSKPIIITFLVLAAVLIPVGVKAAGDCMPIYGGGLNCNNDNKLSIDKKVQAPGTQNFVDSLTKSDKKYKAGDQVKFQITLTNQGRNELSSIEVKDVLPKYTSYVSGAGKYDKKTNSASINISTLKAGESKKIVIVGKVNDVPAATCVVNLAKATSGKLSVDDNSSFCLEKSTEICVDDITQVTTKGGFPVMSAPQNLSETPSTGPAMLPLLSLIPAAAFGIFLRRKK